MTENEITSCSKFMSLILRHKPETIGISLDENGWANTKELIDGMNKASHPVTLEQMKVVVDTNDKKRFIFNEDFSKIRANQGHSINVNVELKEATPPKQLYHGTASRFVSTIRQEGLKPQSRLYLHLSKDVDTAISVGKRHGKPAILVIDSSRMCEDGFKFYISENDVWLTNCIPTKYITEYE